MFQAKQRFLGSADNLKRRRILILHHAILQSSNADQEFERSASQQVDTSCID